MRPGSLPNTSTDRGFIPLNGSTETSTKLIPREIQKRRDIEISLLNVNDHFTARTGWQGWIVLPLLFFQWGCVQRFEKFFCLIIMTQQSILQLEVNGINLNLTGQIRTEYLRIRFHLWSQTFQNSRYKHLLGRPVLLLQTSEGQFCWAKY